MFGHGCNFKHFSWVVQKLCCFHFNAALKLEPPLNFLMVTGNKFLLKTEYYLYNF